MNIVSISSVLNMLAAFAIFGSLIASQSRAVRKEKLDRKEAKKKIKAFNTQRKLDDAALADLNKNLSRVTAPRGPDLEIPPPAKTPEGE